MVGNHAVGCLAPKSFKNCVYMNVCIEGISWPELPVYGLWQRARTRFISGSGFLIPHRRRISHC